MESTPWGGFLFYDWCVNSVLICAANCRFAYRLRYLQSKTKHIIAAGVSHHAIACILCGLMIYKAYALVICNFFEIEIYNGFALDFFTEVWYNALNRIVVWLKITY